MAASSATVSLAANADCMWGPGELAGSVSCTCTAASARVLGHTAWRGCDGPGQQKRLGVAVVSQCSPFVHM